MLLPALRFTNEQRPRAHRRYQAGHHFLDWRVINQNFRLHFAGMQGANKWSKSVTVSTKRKAGSIEILAHPQITPVAILRLSTISALVVIVLVTIATQNLRASPGQADHLGIAQPTGSPLLQYTKLAG